MITHGDFMLTLVLLFSFVLSFFCFVLFMFALYSTVSCFPYYVHIGVFISMLYKAKCANLVTFLPCTKHPKSSFFLFTIKKQHTYSIHHYHTFKQFCSSRSQTNKQGCLMLQDQNSGEIFQTLFKISEYCGYIHNMGNYISCLIIQ